MKTFTMTNAQALTVLLALSTARSEFPGGDNCEIREVQEALRQQWNAQEATEARLGEGYGRPKRVRPFVTRVPSESNPDEHYVVNRSTDGSWSCTCPDFFYRDKPRCKHITDAMIQISYGRYS